MCVVRSFLQRKPGLKIPPNLGKTDRKGKGAGTGCVGRSLDKIKITPHKSRNRIIDREKSSKEVRVSNKIRTGDKVKIKNLKGGPGSIFWCITAELNPSPDSPWELNILPLVKLPKLSCVDNDSARHILAKTTPRTEQPLPSKALRAKFSFSQSPVSCKRMMSESLTKSERALEMSLLRASASALVE